MLYYQDKQARSFSNRKWACFRFCMQPILIVMILLLKCNLFAREANSSLWRADRCYPLRSVSIPFSRWQTCDGKSACYLFMNLTPSLCLALPYSISMCFKQHLSRFALQLFSPRGLCKLILSHMGSKRVHLVCVWEAVHGSSLTFPIPLSFRRVPELCSKASYILCPERIGHSVFLEDGADHSPALQAAGARQPAAAEQSATHHQQALHPQQKVSNSAQNYYAEREVRNMSIPADLFVATDVLVVCLCAGVWENKQKKKIPKPAATSQFLSSTSWTAVLIYFLQPPQCTVLCYPLN